MKREVKVTMIGGKNVGKTCYLHGMYAVMRRGENNFFLHTPDANVDNLLMRNWAALSKRGDRKWPLPTSEELVRYNFSFKRGLSRTIMDFDWIDYRGGALMEDTDTSEELINELNQSNCLFFCVDGAELRTPIADRLYEVDNQLCISRAKVLLDGLPRRVPIVVLITKHDMCRNRLRDDVMKDVELLFDAWLAKGEGWDVMICPVTLGTGLAEDPTSAPISPRNLHLPLIYSVFSMQVDNLVEADRESRRLKEARTASERRIRALSSGFFSSMMNKSEIENVTREANYIAQQLVRHDREAQRLRQDVASLSTELHHAVMFSDGERVTVAT